MNISAWAIKNPIPVILFFLVFTLAGLVGYHTLGINDNPDVDFPMVIVSVSEPGATPTEIETDVTKKVEDAMVGIDHIDHIQSAVVSGASTTTIIFQVGTDTEKSLSDVRDAVSRIRQNLPASVPDPVILHPNTSGLPFITYTVSSDRRSVAELSRLVDNDISRSMLTVEGVSQIQRSGGVDREIKILLDPARLQALGTTVESVNTQVRAMNLNVPGGMAYLGQGQQGIRTLGAVTDVQQLRQTPIILGNGTTATLGSLGTVEDTAADVTQLARLDNKPVVSFGVIRTQGAPLVQTEEAVRKQVAVLQKQLPPDVRLNLVSSMQANITRANFRASIDALAMGALLAVIVIYAFLRNWQATFIAALAIPLSILPTFAVMKWFNYSLNGITLLALTLVVGILVDDAIVDLENIHRHMDMGKGRLQAAFDATDEIGLAVIATTATIVSVFGPVATMGGIVGLFFRSFGVTVVVSVLFSLLVARTVTPLMAAYMLPEHGQVEREPFYRKTYLRLLGMAMNHRWVTLALAVVIFAGSMALTPLLPKGFFSPGDTGEASISVALPAGSDIHQTDAVVQQISAMLIGKPGVDHVYATAGTAVASGFSAPGSGGGVSSATINVFLVPRSERKFSIDDYVNQTRPLLKTVPGARVDISVFGGVGSAKPVNVIIRGDDPVALQRATDAAETQMRNLPVLQDVISSADNLAPEVHIKPDLQKATELGVSVQAIGQAVRLATQGDVDQNLAKFNAGDQQIDILVELKQHVRANLQQLRHLQVQGANGLVPLEQVADVSVGSGPIEIDRYDRARQVTFTANLTKGDLGGAMQQIQDLPAIRNLPPGVSMDTSGQSKFIADTFSNFGYALASGIMFIYVVLVLLFRSFMSPITIMMALPMSFAGAFLGLLLFGKDLGMMALIGIVMLMGLVTKNSILLVDYAIEDRKKGATRRDALLQAGHDRVRPILMTTIAMIAGMLPIALSLGEGTERLSPMACAVIGGLLTSTLLTLLLVPAFFTMVDDVQQFVIRHVSRLGRHVNGSHGNPPRASGSSGATARSHAPE